MIISRTVMPRSFAGDNRSEENGNESFKPVGRRTKRRRMRAERSGSRENDKDGRLQAK
jgi:hypothetical protein